LDTREFTLYDEYRFKLQFFVTFLKKKKIYIVTM